MNVTSIGAGKMARGIGSRLLAGGRTMKFVAPNLEKGRDEGRSPEATVKSDVSIQAVQALDEWHHVCELERK